MNNSSGRILPFTNTEIFSMVFTIFLWTAIILCLTLIPVHITEPQKDYDEPNEGKYVVGIQAKIPMGELGDFKVVITPNE